MNKNRRGITVIPLAVAIFTSCMLLPTAWAQGKLGDQILNGAISAATKRLQEVAPGIGTGSTNAQSAPSAPSGAQAQTNQPPPPWPTKAALLDAARRGEFKGLPEIRVDAEKETAPLTNSVIRILRFEYMVPPLTGNGTMGSLNCRSAAQNEIRRLFTAITDLQIQGLSDKPPTFFRETNTSTSQQNIAIEMRQLGKGSGLCTTKVLGDEKPHPYGAALSKLADEFSAATKAYVDEERGRRVAAYDQEQARMQAERQGKANAQAQREADIRAAEQKRISSERARIEAEQIKRQQQEKNRVAG